MAWEENPRICLHMQLIAILSRTGVKYAQLTIAAIGQSVGYKSQTTFVKQFRKCTGLTPSVYQKFVAEDRRNKETGS